MKGVPYILGRHIIVIKHVRFEIPPHTEIQRELRRGTPVVLEVCTQLSVVGFEAWCTALDNELVRICVIEHLDATPVDRVAIDKLRGIAIAFVDGVTHEVHRRPGLEDVVASSMPAGVRQVVTESNSTLDEVLNRQITTDRGTATGALVDTVHDSGLIG